MRRALESNAAARRPRTCEVFRHVRMRARGHGGGVHARRGAAPAGAPAAAADIGGDWLLAFVVVDGVCFRGFAVAAGSDCARQLLSRARGGAARRPTVRVASPSDVSPPPTARAQASTPDCCRVPETEEVMEITAAPAAQRRERRPLLRGRPSRDFSRQRELPPRRESIARPTVARRRMLVAAARPPHHTPTAARPGWLRDLDAGRRWQDSPRACRWWHQGETRACCRQRPRRGGEDDTQLLMESMRNAVDGDGQLRLRDTLRCSRCATR